MRFLFLDHVFRDLLCFVSIDGFDDDDVEDNVGNKMRNPRLEMRRSSSSLRSMKSHLSQVESIKTLLHHRRQSIIEVQ